MNLSWYKYKLVNIINQINSSFFIKIIVEYKVILG